jgi:hypothetical protein
MSVFVYLSVSCVHVHVCARVHVHVICCYLVLLGSATIIIGEVKRYEPTAVRTYSSRTRLLIVHSIDRKRIYGKNKMKEFYNI